MQSSCIGSLMELADQDKRILYITADSGEGGLDLMFRKNFPDQSFDFGIAEANMVAAAAGLAASGKIPYVYTAAPFLAYRAYEFIRNDICLQNLPVKLIGTGSGLTVSSLGPTHHATEDIGVLRSLPNLTILSPATPRQAYACVKAAYETEGPVYIRLGMNKEKEYFDDEYVFTYGKDDILRNGSDIVIFTSGSIIGEVMEAAELLASGGISAAVVNVAAIKPFDIHHFGQQVQHMNTVCTVEEHNMIGGLGSIVSETLVDLGIKRELIKIGLEDRFSTGYGQLKQVRKENGLDSNSIARKIMGRFQ